MEFLDETIDTPEVLLEDIEAAELALTGIAAATIMEDTTETVQEPTYSLETLESTDSEAAMPQGGGPSPDLETEDSTCITCKEKDCDCFIKR